MTLPFNPGWKYANALSTSFPITMPLPPVMIPAGQVEP